MSFWDARRRRRNHHPKAPGASPEILLVLLHCPATVPSAKCGSALFSQVHVICCPSARSRLNGPPLVAVPGVSLAPTYEYKCADNAAFSKRLKRKSCSAWPCPEMTYKHLALATCVTVRMSRPRLRINKVIDQLPPVAGRFHRIDESASLATFDAFLERDERLVGAKRLCT